MHTFFFIYFCEAKKITETLVVLVLQNCFTILNTKQRIYFLRAVTNNSDNLPGSLRQAIISALAGDTIDFAPVLSGATIVLTSGELLINQNLSIINNNPLTVTISGNNTSRIFNITSGNVTISRLTITNSNNASLGGGGIRNAGNLTITLCNIINNIYSGPVVSIIGGGGLFNTVGSTCNASYCTISNNSSILTNGGGVYNSGTCTMTACAINSNNAFGPGGGINNQNILIMINCIVHGNTANAGIGGGIFFGNTLINQTAVLTNCTITNNTSTLDAFSNSSGGGIGRDANNTTLNTSLGNTIVAQNIIATQIGRDVSGTYVSNGNNFIGTGIGSTGFVNGVNGDQVGTNISPLDPMLNPLGNYGGPTLSRTLQPTSTAIDAGNNALVPIGIIYDQRGPGFPRIINGTVNIGSIEAALVCYSGESFVLTKNILTGETSEIKAKNVYAGVHEVFDTANQIFIPVKLNIIAGPTIRYIKIEKNMLGKNEPSEDFYVTSGHKIVINGIETKAKYIPNVKRIKVEPENVYSICVDKRTSIKINGLNVIAWGYDEWTNYSTKKGLSWSNNNLS